MSATEIAVQGVLLQFGNGASPETFETIANIEKFSWPMKARVVDTSNVSDQYQRQLPTLIETGTVTMDVFWRMGDDSHNQLRNLLISRVAGQPVKRDFQIVYPDGSSVDVFSAYVTSFQITGQVAQVFKATITLSATGAPFLA